MHTEVFQLLAYPFFFLIAGCIIYLQFRMNSNLSHEAHKVPGMFLVMMTASLIATALFDLVIFAFASFRFSRLRFVGPIAYADFLQRPTACMLSAIVAIVGVWFGMRWLGKRQGTFPSRKSHKMEY